MVSADPDSGSPTGALNLNLNASTGLIEGIDYGGSATTTTTISGSTVSPPASSAGPGNGYVADHWVEQGSQGKSSNANWTYVDSETYFDVTATYPIFGSTSTVNVPIDVSAGTTLFSSPLTQNLSQTAGAETTTYGYTFQQNEVWVQQETTNLPDVSGTGDEGTRIGGSDFTQVYLDIHGRPVFTQEANGAIDYSQYDGTTGALLETIQDIKSSQIGVNGVPTLPTGFNLSGRTTRG